MIVLRLDVPALERLIGGDTEVEVRLRQSVVEEFCRRKLNEVLKEKSFAKFLQEESRVVEAGLNALVHERLGQVNKEGWGNVVVVLTDGVRTHLRVEAERQVAEVVRKTVEEQWAYVEKRIAYDVSKALEAKTAALVASLVQERIQKIKEGL